MDSAAGGLGSVTDERNGNVRVTLDGETEVLRPPSEKDVDKQMIVDCGGCSRARDSRRESSRADPPLLGTAPPPDHPLSAQERDERRSASADDKEARALEVLVGGDFETDDDPTARY
jgi:hypothetical protein